MQNISKEDALAFHNVIFCTFQTIRLISLNCSIFAQYIQILATALILDIILINIIDKGKY